MRITEKETTILIKRDQVSDMRPSGMVIGENSSPCFGCDYYKHCLNNRDECGAYRSYINTNQPTNELRVKIIGEQVPDRIRRFGR